MGLPYENPGLLYVAATLLPLLAFVIHFLAGGLRWALRPYRDRGLCRSLYQLLGGDTPGRTLAYLSVAAIGLACVLSVMGLIAYASQPIKKEVRKVFCKAHQQYEDQVLKEARPPFAGSFRWVLLNEALDPYQFRDLDRNADGVLEEEEVVKHTDLNADIFYGKMDADSDAEVSRQEWQDFLTHERAERPALALKLGYHIDALAAVMFVMITFIASLIHIYSLGYMSDELQPMVEDHQAHVRRRGRFPRFFMYLSLFSFSMLHLVLADNLFQIFISWELVGICSYLLIGFYYERRTATNAANKAFITNRIGDAGFIIGLLILWTHLGTFDFFGSEQVVTNRQGEVVKNIDGDPVKIEHPGIFEMIRAPAVDGHNTEIEQRDQIVRVRPEPVEVNKQAFFETDPAGSAVYLFGGHMHAPRKTGDGNYLYDADVHGEPARTMPYWLLVLAGIGIFLGCVGKSAQFPLQVWLPDAMEGPTPVSALIHAATMVAAGVYLVGRAFPLFTPEVLLVIAYVGAITAFLAATIAIVQTDIKKVLAYSTVSQLGFMMLALGVGGWVAGLFHLITHAFFKALLFLGSGSVIHGTHHEQEMTRMGGLYPKMKITALTMLVGVLAIAGTPLFSGWYSKDAILVSSLSFVSLHPQHLLLFLLPLLTAGITAFYMFRLWFMTFTGKPRDPHVYEHAHESPWVMTVPLIVLAFFSIVVAWGPNPFNVQGSVLEHFLHHEQPSSVRYDPALAGSTWQIEGNYFKADESILAAPIFVRNQIGPHDIAGMLALFSAGLGVVLAFIVYYYGILDPELTKAQFAGVHDFLWNKWHFDQLYRVLLVQPALVIAHGCRWFDTRVIDGVVDNSARATVKVSRWDGRFDLGIVDGLVNLTARVIYAVGSWLRVVQTGLIRSYVLFLALAAVGIFAVVSYVIALSE
jgi:NADH-quinone oxidoreductase subunit L